MDELLLNGIPEYLPIHIFVFVKCENQQQQQRYHIPLCLLYEHYQFIIVVQYDEC